MIPVIDLRRQQQAIAPELQAAVSGVLASGEYILGREVAAFEEEFAAYCGVQFAIGVNSGTSALHLALLALGVGPGDEVITVPFTFIATSSTIAYCGARPVYVDIDPATCNLDPAQLERAITARTKAIMPVHLYGQPADMEAIGEIARRHGLPIVEDAAQAHGAETGGRRVGSIGALSCFSFYPTKNLGACGEGGMVTTNDEGLARQVRLLRDWGQDRKYHHVIKGYNYRLEGMQGAILRVKLRHLEAWTEARIERARWYQNALAECGLTLPVVSPGVRHVYCTYTIRTPRRDQLQQELLAGGVQSAIHYAIPSHLQPAFAELGHGAGSFPEAERAAQEVLSLPMFPELTRTEVEQVAQLVREHSAQPA